MDRRTVEVVSFVAAFIGITCFLALVILIPQVAVVLVTAAMVGIVVFVVGVFSLWIAGAAGAAWARRNSDD